MFCTNCGNKLHDEAVMCPNCGTLVKGKALTQKNNVTQDDLSQKENVFGKISNILSTISLALCWTFFIPIILFEISLPLAIVGMCLKNKFPKNSNLAKRGLIKSIISFFAAIFCFVIFYVLFLIIIFSIDPYRVPMPPRVIVAY